MSAAAAPGYLSPQKAAALRQLLLHSHGQFKLQDLQQLLAALVALLLGQGHEQVLQWQHSNALQCHLLLLLLLRRRQRLRRVLVAAQAAAALLPPLPAETSCQLPQPPQPPLVMAALAALALGCCSEAS